LGAAELKERLLEQMGHQVGQHHGVDEQRGTDEQKAERLVAAELGRRHWSEEDLRQRRKTDATKVEIALRLRRETVVTMDWIAERLHMGCRHYGRLIEETISQDKCRREPAWTESIAVG
jgi:hypothetical protein